MKKVTISLPVNQLEKIDKKALKKNGGNRSAYISETISNYEQLQDLFLSASTVISCVVVGENQTQDFSTAVKAYKKKRDKYFAK